MVLKGRLDIVFEVVKIRKVDRVDSSNEEEDLIRQIQLYGGQEEREADYEGKTEQQDDQSLSDPSYKQVKSPTQVTLAQQIKPQPKVEEDQQDNLYPTAVAFAEEYDDMSIDDEQKE